MTRETQMSQAQFQIFLDSHGADPARWPPAQREQAVRLIAQDKAARDLFEAARRLDAMLARFNRATDEDAAAAARVLTRLSAPLPRQKVPLWRLPAVLLDWQFAPAWPRVAALACCLAIGFMVGLAGLDRPYDHLDASFMTTSRDVGSIFEAEPFGGERL